MIEWILITILFIWVFVLTALLIGINIAVNNQEEILYILRNDINNIRFGKNDKI